LCEQLLLVAGQQPWLGVDGKGVASEHAHLSVHGMRLLAMARAALMALRSAAGELSALQGAWLAACGLDSSSTGAQIAALRSRLCLHLDDHAARERFTGDLLRMLHLQ
jgi:hypothetical protein